MITGTPKYMSTYLDTRLQTCLDTRLDTCLDACLDTCLEASLDACLHTCLDTYLDKCLDPCLDTYLDTCLDTCLHADLGNDGLAHEAVGGEGALDDWQRVADDEDANQQRHARQAVELLLRIHTCMDMRRDLCVGMRKKSAGEKCGQTARQTRG